MVPRLARPSRHSRPQASRVDEPFAEHPSVDCSLAGYSAARALAASLSFWPELAAEADSGSGR